jgi:hypothetical protein
MPDARFEVVRHNWRRFPGGWRRIHGETVLASFPARDEAAADATGRERAARVAANPFRCGIVWADRTEMPEPVFADWAADHDLPAPPESEGRRDWAAWWDVLRAELSPAHREMVWEVFPNLKFHAVREREPGPRAFVLYQLADFPIEERVDLPGGGWTYQWDGRIRLLEEGGHPLEVSFDRVRLEAQIPALFDAERADFDPARRYDTRALDSDPFTDPGPPVYAPPAPAHLFRVAEIPLDAEPERNERVYVVCRAAHTISEDGFWAQLESDAALSVVPVRAFRSESDARAYRETLNRQIHEVLDPVMWAPGWSNGTCGSEPLLALATEWGLPPMPTQMSVIRSRGPRVTLSDLAVWWKANNHHLTRERRAQLWANLGDYRYMTIVFAVIPDVPGVQRV